MDENEMSAVTEESAADDWDDIDLSDAPAESEESAPEEEAAADQPAEETEGEGKPEAEAEPQTAENTDQFSLKHLDETRTVDREEVIALAQKGLDYDRIREKYDAAKETVDWYEKNQDSVRFLEDLAKEQGMTLGEMVDATRAQIMANRTKQSLEVCKGIIANERKALELERRQKAIESSGKEADAQAKAKEKMEADVKAFAAAYPEQAKDPNAIPKEVWDAVHQGETLVNAYRAYENKQLKEQLAREKAEAEKRKQEEKNKARSTGSQRSAGRKSDMDEFDRAWYDGT